MPASALRAPAHAVVIDDDVVHRAQHGDVGAFETIYRATAPRIYALCLRMTGDEAEARELTQDAFVRAWEKLDGFRGESAIGTWLHRLAVNLVLEHLRVRRRESLRLVTETADDDEGASFGTRASDTPGTLHLDVDRAIARLPAGARAVITLHLAGYTHDEIAALTGIAAGTARAQLWRARRTLMRVLEP